MKFLGKVFSLIRKLRFYEVLLLVFIGIVLGAWSLKEITESALFCGSTCHIMRPYYEDWKTSNHDTVPCVDCHLEPSDEQQFVPQFKALRQVASYLTRTYGEHRRAEVSDANCLKSGCHSKRLLDGRVTFADNIRFDHTPHLQQLRRGKILRCTTCHSRVAMGEHVTVVEDSCFICHFKGGGREPATSDCLLCHNTGGEPEGQKAAAFDHSPLLERGVPCISCHQGVTRGDGHLKSESCVECHDRSMEHALDEPVELIHRVHVTDHKVECNLCHEPIRHSMPDEEVAEPLYCRSCHEGKHEGIMDLFRGTGAKGVPTMPSTMYRAHVGCNGCHIVPDPSGGMGAAFRGMTMVSVEAACRSCHEEGYSGRVTQWKNDLSRALASAEGTLARVEKALSVQAYQEPAIRRTMEDVRHNILFIRYSAPIHNPDYAIQVLDKAVRDLTLLLERTRQG